jgi:hypothetical protein
MADARLKIVIEALNAAKGELKGLQDDLEGVQSKGKKASGGFKVLGDDMKKMVTAAGIATAGVVAFGMAAKKAFDFAAEGAKVAQTTASFDRLGVSIQALRAASLGTVDDMTLMSSSLALVAGASVDLQSHLLNAAPQLMQIAKAASALNPHLGDTAHMFESVALGIKRGSPMILDNLGIIVKVGEANEKYAAALGKTVQALTAEETQIALLNATLEAGGRLIEQAGGSAESAADSYERFATNIANSTADMKSNVHTGLQPLVDWLNKTLFVTRELRNEQELLRQQSMGGGNTYADYLAAQKKLIEDSGAAGQNDFWMRFQAMTKGTPVAREMSWADKDLDKALQHIARGTIRITGIMSNYDFIVNQVRKSSSDAGVAVLRMGDALEQQASMASLAGTNSMEMVDVYNQATGAIGATATALDLQAKAAERANEAAKQAGRVAHTKFGVDAPLSKNLEEGAEKLAELRDTAADLAGQIASLEGMRYRTEKQDEELAGLKSGLADVTSEIEGVISGMREMSARFVLGLIEMQIAADGVITEAEARIYTGYARSLGLIDDQAVRTANLVTSVLADVASGAIDAQEGINILTGATGELVDGVVEVGPAAETAMSQVETATGAAKAMMIELGQEADNTQAKINSMHGKTINVGVNWIVPDIPHRAVGSLGERGPHFATGGFVPMGGDAYVGERGMERVRVTPSGVQVTPVTNQTYNNNYNINVGSNGAAYSAAAALRAMYG